LVDVPPETVTTKAMDCAVVAGLGEPAAREVVVVAPVTTKIEDRRQAWSSNRSHR